MIRVDYRLYCVTLAVCSGMWRWD